MTRELCVYCNLRRGTTRDHVPARSLFPPPRPHNLITVPCCEPCRRATTLDDEYIKFILLMRWEAEESESARACRPGLYRSLDRPEAAGFLGLILANTREVNVLTPAGLHLGRKATHIVDHLRVERVIGRTVWALFFHHFKMRLPADCVAAVWDVARLQDIGRLEQVARVVAPLKHSEEHVIGGDVFAYRFLSASEQPTTSAWLLTFYGAVEFVVLTVPRAMAPRPLVHGLSTSTTAAGGLAADP